MRLKLVFKLTLVSLLMSACLFAHAKINVVIEGVSDEAALKNIQARLGVMQIDESIEAPPRHLRSLYLRGEHEIKEALQPFGYYRAQVQSEIAQSGKNWKIKYKITLGNPVKITEVTNVLEGPGDNHPLFIQLHDQFPLKEGDTFNQLAYDDYKKAMLNTADIYGYFHARFLTQQILIDPKANTAQIHLVFNTGRAFYYGNIKFESEYFSPKLLNRFLNIKPGEPYDENKIAQLQADLLNSGFFASSLVEADRETMGESDIPIVVEVTPRNRFTYTAGAGYGTDMGARANLGFQWRRITDTGHSLRLDLLPAQYLQQYSLGYRIPAEQPARDYYEVYTAYIVEQPEGRTLDSTTKQLGGLWSVGQSLNSVQRIVSLTYQEDDYIDQEGNTTSTLVLPQVSWEWVNTKDRYNVRQGYRARVDLRGTSEFLGSTTEFLQGEVYGKAIYSFTDSTRLITRGHFGTTLDATLEAIPPSLRFYAGGDNSVRGYVFEGLGETVINDNGKKQNIGGSYILVGSVEIDQLIYGDFGMAVFFDTGNAMIKLTEPLAQGFGVGFRYKTPIGSLRFDLATPISESTNQVRIHFAMGPEL